MRRHRLPCAARSVAVCGFAITGALAVWANAAPAATQATSEQRCLALSMYWEARSEGVEGMRAVGSVVLNRIASADFPDTVCGVVYQGGETPPCQFSWWCDGRSDVPRERDQWQTALKLAEKMLASRGKDPTDGALFFHHAKLPVPWRIKRTRTVRILNHIYYR